jgi:hypothetical protein
MADIEGISSFCWTLLDFSLSEGLIANSFAIIAHTNGVNYFLHFK